MTASGRHASPIRVTLQRWTRSESPGDAAFKLVSGLFAAAIVATFVYVLFILADRAWPAIRAFGPGFFVNDRWDPQEERFGAYAYVVGTVSTSLIALTLALPVSIGTAISLTQLLHVRVSQVLGLFVELLAAVPSIVFGVWGYVVIVPFVHKIGPPGTPGPSILAAGLVLAVMVLPILASLSRDMLYAVPSSQREAALALGATPWEVTWRVTIPNAKSGLVAATILAFGRAFGETMAVIMVVGNQARVPRNIWSSGSTITSVIAGENGDPSGPLHTASLVELGLVLMTVSVLLSIVSRILIRILARRLGGRVA